MSYLLYGQNSLLLDERVAQLRAELDPSGVGTSVIDVQASSLSEIAAAVQALPFFGGQRIVVLLNPIGGKRGAATSEDDEAEGDGGGRIRWPELNPLLTSVPPTTCLVLRHDGALAQTHFLVKAAKTAGWTTESHPIPRGDDLLDWVSRRSRSLGVTVAPDAAMALLDRLHPTSWGKASLYETDTPNPRQIASELDKLACAAEDDLVTVALVQELIADRAGYTAFGLNDRAFAGHTAEALVELANVLEAGEPEERLIAHLASEAAALASLGQIRELGPAAVAGAAGISESRVQTMQRKPGASLSRAQQRRVAELVRASDALVKTGKAHDASATIVPAVAGVAEAVRSGGGRGRRRS